MKASMPECHIENANQDPINSPAGQNVQVSITRTKSEAFLQYDLAGH
jgi:hypothetical protein